jgi:hypothetical protein
MQAMPEETATSVPETEDGGEVMSTAKIVNQKPGPFKPAVRFTVNPLFEEFLQRLSGAGIAVTPLPQAEMTALAEANKWVGLQGWPGGWSETRIEIDNDVIVVWCGAARVADSSSLDKDAVREVWLSIPQEASTDAA